MSWNQRRQNNRRHRDPNILVMMKTLYRCRNASVSEEFAGRRQFVREWEPRLVGLLRNVLFCRRKDTCRHNYQWMKDSHTRVSHWKCDRRHNDRFECAEDGGRAIRGLSHLGKHRNRELNTGANTTVH